MTDSSFLRGSIYSKTLCTECRKVPHEKYALGYMLLCKKCYMGYWNQTGKHLVGHIKNCIKK